VGVGLRIGRNAVRGPRDFFADVSLFKNFSVTERVKRQSPIVTTAIIEAKSDEHKRERTAAGAQIRAGNYSWLVRAAGIGIGTRKLLARI
jgi:hypothetical protein